MRRRNELLDDWRMIGQRPYFFGIVGSDLDVWVTVSAPWIHVIRPAELANSPEPLKGGVVDDVSFPVVDFDKAVYRTPELIRLI